MGKKHRNVTHDFMDDLARAQFGDARLTKTLVKVARQAQEDPSCSFPEMVDTDSELTGLYRILSNKRVTATALHEPQAEGAVRRAAAVDRVLVVSDTTDFNFGSSRKGLGPITDGGSGFFFHAALAVSARTKLPLGVVAYETYVREDKPTRGARAELGMKKARRSQARDRTEDNEGARWWRVAEAAQARCAGLDRAPIHVMDSEADSYALLARLHANCRFIVRAKHDRVLVPTGDVVEPERLFSAVTLLSARESRKTAVGGRKAKGLPKADKTHPPRNARLATLEFAATSVTLKRPHHAPTDCPAVLTLNVVHVREPNPPEGAEPIEWLLLTSEPIANSKQLLRIVDDYRARWVIEEFNKALKTGCRIESRQLESRHALENALMLFLPIACQMLRLRTLAQFAPELDAGAVLTERQLLVLGLIARTPLPKKPSSHDVLYAVARLGGHWRSNGPPGWEILAKGFRRLISAEEILSLGATSAGRRVLQRFV